MCPYIDNLVVTLVIGDKTHVILGHDTLDLLITLGNKLLLLLRNDDIVKVE